MYLFLKSFYFYCLSLSDILIVYMKIHYEGYVWEMSPR